MPIHNERFLERLDKMVDAGRLTAEDAERLRAANPSERDDIIRTIRLSHVKAKLDPAVHDGRLTQEEAEDILSRVADGERPRVLGRLRQTANEDGRRGTPGTTARRLASGDD
ncbi:MAG: hypothetical protein ACRDYF_01670 [Acidimicrobiia bacterium]